MILALTLLVGCTGKDPGGDLPKPAETDTFTVPEPTTPPEPTGPKGPAIVLAIGDGMGFEHVAAGATFATGSPTGLRMQALPVSGAVRTASFDGITDSAAAGTAFACGVHTHNDAIGQDRDGNDVENLVELARSLGLATGVVTTAELPHATPAVFTAHHPNRNEEQLIADEQVLLGADVMLGGGSDFYVDLQDDIGAAGWPWVETSVALGKAVGPQVWGAFAPKHLPFVILGTPDPGLPDLVADALARLEVDPDGFFLMIEGARIDHASHGNDAEQMVGEVAAFDEALGVLLDWSEDGPRDLFLVVTADHECGGLEVVSASGIGEVPEVTWRWGSHTNADVPLFAVGDGTDVFHDALVDHREVHARFVERLTGTYTAPPPELLPDGRHDDLPHRLAEQTVPSSLGDDLGRLEALALGADERGLSIGIEGLFPWQTATVVVLLDVDLGEGTGTTTLLGATSGATTPAEAVIDGLRLQTLPPGFGADLVLVSVGGTETPYAGGFRGLFGLRPPWGMLSDVQPLPVAINYGPDARTRPTEPGAVATGVGFEASIDWADVYPSLGGLVPPGARVGVIAALVGADGTWTTNQVLPPFPAGTPAPGPAPVTLPGLVAYPIDPDGDGVPTPGTPTVQ